VGNTASGLRSTTTNGNDYLHHEIKNHEGHEGHKGVFEIVDFRFQIDPNRNDRMSHSAICNQQSAIVSLRVLCG
jgi:hypothetical protein